MSANPKKLMIFFGGLAAGAALLMVGANALLKRLTPADEVKNPPLPLISETPLPEGATRIIEPSTVADTRPVIYSESGFAPKETTIKSSDVYGCLISVVNRSSQKIKVGVSPHSAAGDPGSDYGELQPDEVGIYDVRYPGFAEMTLHNHFEPAREFKVIYGEGCK